jgi:hypothetical protein
VCGLITTLSKTAFIIILFNIQTLFWVSNKYETIIFLYILGSKD